MDSYPFYNWPEDELRELLNKVLEKLRREYKKWKGKNLSQRSIADQANVDYFAISKAKKEDSHFSGQSIYRIISDISDNFQIEYDRSGNIQKIGKFQDERADASNELHFIYYFLGRKFTPNEEPKRAVVRIDLDSEEVELTMYKTTPRGPRMRYRGEVKVFPNREFFLIFQSRENLEKGYVEEVPGLCCFALNGSLVDEDWYLGVYTGTDARSGLCLMARKSPSELEEAIRTEETPPLVSYLLSHHRLSVKEGPDRILDAKDTLKSISQFEGVYDAYLLEVRKDREFIHKLIIKIFDGCWIRFYSKITGEYTGIIHQILNNKFLIATFGYQSKGGYYDFSIILDVAPTSINGGSQEEYMLGIYGGMEQQNNVPVAGRILLRKSENAYEKSHRMQIPLYVESELKAILTKEPVLKPFCGGIRSICGCARDY
ncbi:MAG: hypothetical protein IPL49_22120 [Saprospirales bacterium]|nr:hypothetical protein [Saprospirales bacterium]